MTGKWLIELIKRAIVEFRGDVAWTERQWIAVSTAVVFKWSLWLAPVSYKENEGKGRPPTLHWQSCPHKQMAVEKQISL